MGYAGLAQLHISGVGQAMQIDDGRQIQSNAIDAFADPLARDRAGVRLYHHFFPCKTQFVSVAADASCTVAAHFAPVSVRIVKMQAEICGIGRIHS